MESKTSYSLKTLKVNNFSLKKKEMENNFYII